MEKYLIVNTGSTSKKFAVYANGKMIASAHLESLGDGSFMMHISQDGRKEGNKISKEEFDLSIKTIIDKFISLKVFSETLDIGAIVLRVVAADSYFTEHRVVDEEYVEKLNSPKHDASIHISLVLKDIKQIEKYFPKIKIVGISDSAFHKSMPSVSKQYALPEKEEKDLDIYKFGYHGISLQSICEQVKDTKENLPSKMIIAHMGGGISLTAILDGQSIDTTMGMTPLEGIPMSTRIGDIDPGAVIYLLNQKKMGLKEAKLYLNSKCGLLGISGVSGDVRVLLEEEKRGNEDAKLALDKLAFAVKKYIGAYTAILGGLDMIVFTATIGERSFPVRQRICSDLRHLGIVLDKEKNNQDPLKDTFIQAVDSKVEIAVFHTNEARVMYEEAVKLEKS